MDERPIVRELREYFESQAPRITSLLYPFLQLVGQSIFEFTPSDCRPLDINSVGVLFELEAQLATVLKPIIRDIYEEEVEIIDTLLVIAESNSQIIALLNTLLLKGYKNKDTGTVSIITDPPSYVVLFSLIYRIYLCNSGPISSKVIQAFQTVGKVTNGHIPQWLIDSEIEFFELLRRQNYLLCVCVSILKSRNKLR